MDSLTNTAGFELTPKVIERLEQVRLFYAMTAKQFAEFLGLEVPDYQDVMSGKMPMPEHSLDVLILDLDVQKEWLVTGNGNARYNAGNRDFDALRHRICRFEKYLGVELDPDLKDRCAYRLSRLPPGHSVDDDMIEELVSRVARDHRALPNLAPAQLPMK